MCINSTPNIKNRIIPIFISHMGCPNQCVFCDQKSISGTVVPMSPSDVKKHVENILASNELSSKVSEIAFFGGSFTGLEPGLQEEYLSSIGKFNLPVRISTRPDYIDESVLNRLKKHNVRIIELGVQSMSDDILEAAGRGHTVKHVLDACNLIKKHKFLLGIQTMIGLPLETLESVLHTANEVALLNPDMVRIYPVLVLKGTQLENMMEFGGYTPLTLELAVEYAAMALSIYKKHDINVIRVGLQSSDEISSKTDSKIFGGPIHPAFRQLVESTMLAKALYSYDIKKIICGVNSIHLLKGHNNYGLNMLLNLSGKSKIELSVSNEIAPDNVKIICNKNYVPILELGYSL